MLSQKDIETLTVPKNAKLDALFDVLNKLNDADEILDDAVYGFVPFSSNEEWQNEADNFFWHSEGMKEINDVAIALSKARDLAKHAIHVLEGTTEAQAAY